MRRQLPLSLSPDGDPFVVTVPWRTLISQLFAEETAVLQMLADGTADSFLRPLVQQVKLVAREEPAEALARTFVRANRRKRAAYSHRRYDRVGLGDHPDWNKASLNPSFDDDADAARRRGALAP